MANIELEYPDVSKRIIYLNDVIDNNTTKEFTQHLNEIDFEDFYITKSNIAKINALGIEADKFELPPIKVMLNSPGGSVYDALAIYDMINKRKDMICMCSGKVMK